VSPSSHNVGPTVIWSHFGIGFGLTGPSKRNLINILK
jgi:hypothetical protein